VLGGVLLLGFAFRAVPLQDLKRALSEVAWAGLLPLALLNAAIPFAAALRGWRLLRAAGGRVPLTLFSGYRLACGAVSFVTPGPQVGGEPLLLYWLTRGQGVRPERALAAIALDRGIEMALTGGVLCLGLALSAAWPVNRQPPSTVALSALAAAALLPFAYSLVLVRGGRPLARLAAAGGGDPPSWLRWLLQAEAHAGDMCRGRPTLLAAALGDSALSWSLVMAEFWLLFLLVGRALSPAELLMVLGVSRGALLTPLPGGIGALEASLVLAAGLLALPPATALAAAALIRGRDILMATMGLVLAGRFALACRPVAAVPPLASEAAGDAALSG
jgi:hypothetical protein